MYSGKHGLCTTVSKDSISGSLFVYYTIRHSVTPVMCIHIAVWSHISFAKDSRANSWLNLMMAHYIIEFSLIISDRHYCSCFHFTFAVLLPKHSTCQCTGTKHSRKLAKWLGGSHQFLLYCWVERQTARVQIEEASIVAIWRTLTLPHSPSFRLIFNLQ